MPRSIPPPAACTAKPPLATPAASSLPSSRKFYLCVRLGNSEFLQQHPRVQFHFTPTYSSWLNQVEIWFAKIEREVIARGIFTSVSDLAQTPPLYQRLFCQRSAYPLEIF